MSGDRTGLVTTGGSAGRPWGLWARQILAVIRLETRKSFLSRRGLALLVLALLPVGIFFLRILTEPLLRVHATIGGSVTLFGLVFQSFILRMGIFFGCVGVFSGLFRGEVLDRSLHYYFLAPIRREVLVVGKYLAGVLATATVFSISTVLSALLCYVPNGRALAVEHLLHGPGLSYLFWYLVVVILACVGYGAVFLAMGLFLKNPILAAVPVLGWEMINFLLPPLLKKISIIYYLQSLCPFQISQGPVAILADASPAWLAIPGLFAVTIALLALASFKARRFEINYGTD